MVSWSNVLTIRRERSFFLKIFISCAWIWSLRLLSQHFQYNGPITPDIIVPPLPFFWNVAISLSNFALFFLYLEKTLLFLTIEFCKKYFSSYKAFATNTKSYLCFKYGGQEHDSKFYTYRPTTPWLQGPTASFFWNFKIFLHKKI